MPQTARPFLFPSTPPVMTSCFLSEIQYGRDLSNRLKNQRCALCMGLQAHDSYMLDHFTARLATPRAWLHWWRHWGRRASRSVAVVAAAEILRFFWYLKKSDICTFCLQCLVVCSGLLMKKTRFKISPLYLRIFAVQATRTRRPGIASLGLTDVAISISSITIVNTSHVASSLGGKMSRCILCARLTSLTKACSLYRPCKNVCWQIACC